MQTRESVPAPFIVGVSRSGTTLLRLMLDAHPDVAIPSETHFIGNLLGQNSSSMAPDSFVHTLITSSTWPNFSISDRAFRHAIGELKPFTVSEGIRTFYRMYAKSAGKARWGDKTPPYRTIMIGIGQLLAEARFIHIIRDGRDVALSYRGLWFGPGDDIEAQASFWVEQIFSMRRQATELAHYLEIRYEHLVESPKATLMTVCTFLDLPFHPSMLRYFETASSRLSEIKQAFGPGGAMTMDVAKFVTIYERTKEPLDLNRVGRWRNEMPDDQQRKYEMIAGTLLRELGYETRFPPTLTA